MKKEKEPCRSMAQEENHISDKLYATLHVKKGQLPNNRPFDLKIRNKTNVDATVNVRRFKEEFKAIVQDAIKKDKTYVMILAFSVFALLVSLVALIISICMLNS